jgi:hypothetical protein
MTGLGLGFAVLAVWVFWPVFGPDADDAGRQVTGGRS